MPSEQYPFFMELVDRLGFVSLSYEPSQDDHLENLLSDLKESFKEVSLHQQGKLQLRNARDLIEELQGEDYSTV